ncbi:hypothetical protein U0070_019259 [Myodes glareolus]|uniref:Uncharacterized protein n=1 Tax=Myodes glareolus TaxID=447135 RepID=A0AAW0IWC6_MYOGA
MTEIPFTVFLFSLKTLEDLFDHEREQDRAKQLRAVNKQRGQACKDGNQTKGITGLERMFIYANARKQVIQNINQLKFDDSEKRVTLIRGSTSRPSFVSL